MPNILREVSVLQQEGKLHTRLVTRTRIFLVVSLILLCVSLYFIFAQGANAALSGALALAGLVIGYFVFSRITPVQWNTETEQVESASMGALGYSMIGLYIVFEIGARTVLSNELGASAEGYVFALIFGLILGRTLGVVAEIHRVYTATHATN